MEKYNWKIIASAIVALGIFGAGLALRSGIIKFKSMERTVSVRGLSEREVQADKVIWRISHSEYGDNLLSLYAKVEKNNELIKQTLMANGLEEKEILISSPSMNNLEQQYSYSDKRPLYKYSIYSSMTVSSNKIDIVRKLTTDLVSTMIEKGVTLDSWADYQFTGLNDIKPQMIEDATKNARLSAQKFAEDSNSKIGKIKNATQSVFTINNLDENTPYNKKVRVDTSVVYYLN